MELPEDPPPGLLMSMALRYDHGLCCPGYYDMLGEGEHKKRLDAALALMRQLYDEVSGHGFYSPDSEHRYVEMMANAELTGASGAVAAKRPVE